MRMLKKHIRAALLIACALPLAATGRRHPSTARSPPKRTAKS